MKSLMTCLVLVASLALSACESDGVKVMKSPCVGLDGSPCGPKRTPEGNRHA